MPVPSEPLWSQSTNTPVKKKKKIQRKKEKKKTQKTHKATNIQACFEI